MSNKYKNQDEVPTEVICKRLDELSAAVTKGRDAVAREFVMRIPAELDHDADLVLSIASRRLRELSKANGSKYEHWAFFEIDDEFGTQTQSKEQIYQDFKQRLMEEVYAHFDEMDHGDRPLELREYAEK